MIQLPLSEWYIFSLLYYELILMTHKHTTIEINTSTHDMLEQIKKIFVSYTGEDLENFTDDKIIEILASGFLGSEDEGAEECGDDCGCHHEHHHDQGHHHHHGEKDGCCGHCK